MISEEPTLSFSVTVYPFAANAWLRVILMVPIPFCFISITNAAYVGLPREASNQVSGIINFVRNVGVGHEEESMRGHAYIRYQDVEVPKDHLLGERGGGFVVAQTRLGGGRIHHAMRTIGQVRRAFDLMCERALSRTTQGSRTVRLPDSRS